MSTHLQNLHDVVQEIYLNKGLSIRGIAKKMGINHSQVSRPLNGITAVKRDWLLRLCEALECTYPELARIFETTDFRAPTPKEWEDKEHHTIRNKTPGLAA
jgi:DNA-binding Xre family transcriptional regulator